MNNPALSVIMAIYNKESFLHRSIRSILVQTFADFELILVDDGSTDASLDVCREFAREDSRIHIIHQENAGVSAARQRGIECACGDYSIHIDPDDWIDCSYFEEMYRTAMETGADMVISDFYVDNEAGTIYKPQKPSATDHGRVLKDLFDQLHGSVCNKLIRHVCYAQFGVSFPAKLNYCEDFVVCASLLKHPIRVAYLDKAFYHYDCSQANDSLTKCYTRRHLEASLCVAEELKRRLSGSVDCDRLVRQYERRVRFMTFENGLLTRSEFAALFPEAGKGTEGLRTSLVNRMLYRGACLGLYDICASLLHAKNRLRNNNLR